MFKAPAIRIALSFAIVILIGTILFLLPISSPQGKQMTFLQSLFTSTSSVCVTGLNVINPSFDLSVFGQIMLLILVQIGGLGLMTLASMLLIILGKKITLQDRLTLTESFNQEELSGIVKLTKKIIIYTAVIELFGAVFLSFSFVPKYGAVGLYYAIFHSISAFCNAGMVILPDPMTGFQSDVVMNLSVMLLIFLGGIGFSVLTDVVKSKKPSKFLFHTKMVLLASFSLILMTALSVFFLEFHNQSTMGNLSFGKKIMASFFQAVTLRTAGFNTIEQSGMTYGSKVLSMLNMFIGASPGSTGGGIKTTTFVVLLFTLISGVTSSDKEIVIRGRSVTQRTLMRVILLVTFSCLINFIFLFMISIAEGGSGISVDALLFEVLSAYNTVGLSYGITPQLTHISQIFIIILMFTGRLGGIVLTLLFLRKNNDPLTIKYPDMHIMVG